MFWKVVLTITIFSCQKTESANIFAILPFPSRSYFRPVEVLLKALAEKGHSVDFATHYPSGTNITNYQELNLNGTIPLHANNLSIHHYSTFSTYRFIKYTIQNAGIDACKAVFNTPVIKNLKNTPKKYDLVITQILGSDCFLGFGHLFNAPVISVMAMTDLPWASDRVGNPDNPAYIPNWYTFRDGQMSFFGRVKNVVLWVSTRFLYQYWSSKESNQVCREFFGGGTPALESLALKTSLILSTGHYSMCTVRPVVPNFLQVGGVQIRLNGTKLEDLVQTSTRGVIYLSMGSMLMTETFDFDKLQGILDAFSVLPYKVLWKGDPQKFPKSLVIPTNIHFKKWMPQVDILCDPNTKLFVTHGGLFGSQEAIYCGVPRLGIPLYADQVGNIEISEKKGIGIKVSYSDISKETILEAARKLLNNKSYQENARRMSQIFRDRPIVPLDAATYWIEYVIRHGGAPQMKSAKAGLSWYKYYLVDVGLILTAVLFLVFLSIVFNKRTVNNIGT